jgi:hypothetical protein
MKAQLILEFVIASILFFGILLYTINYVNSNVADFRTKAYQNYLQTKALEISEILMNKESSLSLIDDYGFNVTKINKFNETYCNLGAQYKKLVEVLNLYKETESIPIHNDIRMEIFDVENSHVLLSCGPEVPRNVGKVEITRVGLCEGFLCTLRIVVW